MSTPDPVLDTPTAPVTMPPMPAHHVALLLRGLERYQEIQLKLHTLGVTSVDGFTERYDPAHRAEAKLRAALDSWANEHAVTAPPVPGALDATWPEVPPVEMGTLTLAQLWCLRLATDWVFSTEMDTARETGTWPEPGFMAPLAAAQQTLFAILGAHGVRDAM